MANKQESNKNNKEKRGLIARLVARVVAWLRGFVISILSQGQVPRHIAFIMDGNRRYAKKSHLANLQGHSAGFDTLEKGYSAGLKSSDEILKWCMDLGIKEVTVYAFSIENFKRPKDEVDGLMDLTAEKFNLITQENQMVDRLGIRVRVMGDMELIPEKTRIAIDKVVEYSRNNTNATLNVCLAYTARDEITRAVQKIANTAVRARELQRAGQLHRAQEGDEGRLLRLVQGGEGALVEPPPGKDSGWGEEEYEKGERGRLWGWEDELWNAMDITSAPELLVRTSGEVRFSDFMLWQAKRKYYINNIKNRGRSEDSCD